MIKINRLLWGIPGLAIYFYSITVLTQAGYDSYFGIPSNFVEESLKANILYLFSLFQAGTYAAGLMRWWMWFILVIAILLIAALWFSNKIWRYIFSIVTIIFWVVTVYYSYNFGISLAQNTANFYLPTTNCTAIGPDEMYISPTISGDEAIFISVDPTTKAMRDGFIVKKLSDLPCKLKYQKLWLLTP